MLAKLDQASGPQVKWSVSLVIADGYLILFRGLCRYALIDTLTLSPHDGDLFKAACDQTPDHLISERACRADGSAATMSCPRILL